MKRAVTSVLPCLLAGLWASNASADLIEIWASGEISTGSDQQCLFGDDDPCPLGGFDFAGAGVSVEAAWTFDTDTAPADSDARPDHSQRSAATDWIDLYLRVFDASTSFEFLASSFVSEPDNLFGLLNVSNEAVESIFVDARYNDGFAADDPTQNILRADLSVQIVDQLLSDMLTDSFTWESGGDPGNGGFGEFDAFACVAFEGCSYEMDGVFQVDLLRVTNLSSVEEPASVPEPAALGLLCTGLLLMLVGRRRRLPG